MDYLTIDNLTTFLKKERIIFVVFIIIITIFIKYFFYCLFSIDLSYLKKRFFFEFRWKILL